jgi:hypothetical protein
VKVLKLEVHALVQCERMCLVFEVQELRSIQEVNPPVLSLPLQTQYGFVEFALFVDMVHVQTGIAGTCRLNKADGRQLIEFFKCLVVLIVEIEL